MKGDVFEPNALVFAKVRGYPAWPAKVTAALDDSKKPKKYSVFFFGTYEVATVKVEDLFAYNAQTREKYGNVNVKRKGFLEAMQEIQANPNMEVTGLPPPPTTPATPRTASSAGTTPSGTPKGRGRGKKRKEDASTPVEPAGKRRRVDSGESPGATPAPPAEPVLSRSGRKIKPKRFADADEAKLKSKSPAAGRRQAAAAAAAPAAAPAVQPSSDEESPEVKTVEEEEEEPVAPAEEEEEQMEEEEEVDDVVPMEVAEGGAGDGPDQQAAEPAEEQEPEPERRDVRYKPYPAHDTEDIVRVADSASIQHGDDGRKVMYVKAKCGEMLEIDISDKERPKEFKSEKARIMWDTATAINLARLRHGLENGEYIPDRLREKLLARADVADDYKEKLKNEKRKDIRRSKLWWMRDEARLIEMDYHIKLNLIIDEQDHEKCLAVFKELAVMNMAPLMLKKNPEIVETVRKCRKYTGSAEIREEADKCYQKFKKMFVVPKGKMFREYFDEQLAMFRKVTEEMPEERVVRMVRDPLFQRPGDISSDSEDENWPPAPPKTNGTADKEQTNGAQEPEKEQEPAKEQEQRTNGAQEPEQADKTADTAPAPDTAAADTDDTAADAVEEKTTPATESGSDSPQKTAAPAAETEKETEAVMETAGGDAPAPQEDETADETAAQTETETAADEPAAAEETAETEETEATEATEETAAKDAAEEPSTEDQPEPEPEPAGDTADQ